MAGWAYREGWGKYWLTQEDWARPVIRNYFSIDSDPVKMLGGWLAAVLLRRGDVRPASQMVTVGLTEAQEQEILRTVGVGRDHEGLRSGAAQLPMQHPGNISPESPRASAVAKLAGSE